ncbi:MAG TPA: UDP-glucose/GDP-mannose dehydrogenase family protein [Acidimicrobiia bacterium]|nr:UDP-glucose/GDP-mannose dehydrogenase family protein [Acidimicrobiia bacterium]
MSRISIVGTGYVGLVTGACLASLGHDVTCVDVDVERVDAIRRGVVPFHEPGLDQLVASTVSRNLHATSSLEDAVAATDVTFVAVGTPSRPDGTINLDQVRAAVKEVGGTLGRTGKSHIVVIKSTVVPGSTERTVIPAIEEASGRSVGNELAVVVNPEFLTEGTAIEDFLHPDRIVVGSTDKEAARRVADLFEVDESVPVLITSSGTAEMIKYASNTLLATLISFSNQIADLGSAMGDIDAAEVMSGVRLSRYLTRGGETASIGSFLEAGCGFGGSCLPKDTAALTAEGARHGVEVGLLRSVLEINTDRPARLLELVLEAQPDLSKSKVAVLGLAFKPDTDDVRESPAFPLVSRLLEAGAEVITHDPVVGAESIPVELRHQVKHLKDLSEVAAIADVLVIVTRWAEYLKIPELIAYREEAPLVVDGRRMLDPKAVPNYRGIGLPRRHG